MLAGLAAAIAGVEAVTLLKPSGVVLGMLVVLVFLAWFVGACAMLGFVRWFFASEFSRVKREHAASAERESKQESKRRAGD